MDHQRHFTWNIIYFVVVVEEKSEYPQSPSNCLCIIYAPWPPLPIIISIV